MTETRHLNSKKVSKYISRFARKYFENPTFEQSATTDFELNGKKAICCNINAIKNARLIEDKTGDFSDIFFAALRIYCFVYGRSLLIGRQPNYAVTQIYVPALGLFVAKKSKNIASQLKKFKTVRARDFFV
jgi:hypothetical protein